MQVVAHLELISPHSEADPHCLFHADGVLWGIGGEGWFVEIVFAAVAEGGGSVVASLGFVVEVDGVSGCGGEYLGLSSGKRCDLPKEYLFLRYVL